MAAPFELKIVTPEGQVYQGMVQSVRLPGTDGDFGVLARHAPLLAALQAGTLRVTTDAGEKRTWAIGEGFLEVGNGETTVLCDFANTPEEIDRQRAEQAETRAKDRLRSRDQMIDRARAEASLARAVARLRTIGTPSL